VGFKNQWPDKQSQFLVMLAIQQISPIKIKAGFASNRIFLPIGCKLIPFSEHCDGMGILTGLVGFSKKRYWHCLVLVLEFR
jgi:hypothetical protein